MTFAVNHLAPFLLTNLLLERLKASAPARIVTVASRAHRGYRIDLAAITGAHDWSMMKAYGRSKLSNILFSRELARRLRRHRRDCDLPASWRSRHRTRPSWWVRRAWLAAAKPFMISAERGAETSLFLATVPDPQVVQRRLCRRHGFGAPRSRCPRRRDGEAPMGRKRAARRPVTSRCRDARTNVFGAASGFL